MRRFLACLLLVTLTACGDKSVATVDLEPASPYQTADSTQTPSLLPALTGIILPTPTIFTYVIVDGDTLGSIAQRHGVTLEALVNANPGVQPTALLVGTELVIPTGNEIPGEATPTPAPPTVQQARCWPEATGGLWCLALVKNEYAETLENISAQFTLLDPGGQEFASQTAYALLNILPAGESMPLAIHFPGPQPVDARVRLQMLTSNRLLPGDIRYLPTLLENTLVSVQASGRTAQVTGRVVLTGEGTANTLWVLASAYDSAGNVVGVRRWESPSALVSGTPVSFDFQVSSLGPEIVLVKFLAEARP